MSRRRDREKRARRRAWYDSDLFRVPRANHQMSLDRKAGVFDRCSACGDLMHERDRCPALAKFWIDLNKTGTAVYPGKISYLRIEGKIEP